jgi:excisionase family DNA binding protein
MSGKKKVAESAKPEPRTFKIEEAAHILGISRAGAYARAKDGSIPVIRLGGRVLVPRAAFERLLAGEQAA